MRVTAFCRIASLQSIHLRPLKALRQTCLFPGPRFCSTEYPRSSIGVIHHLFLRSLVERVSMAFTSAFHSAFNVTGKDIVSCYSPALGCNAALEMLWLQ